MKPDLIYLATPYSKYKAGIAMAYIEAARLTARLLRAGHRVYSPIVHTHPIAVYGNIDPYDHDVWLPFDEAMMTAADELWVAKMEGWEQSKGIAHEIDFFNKAGKLCWFVDPETLLVGGCP